MKVTLLFAVGLLISGCATLRSDRPDDITGFYELIQGGYNEELFLELKENGAYILDYIFIGDVVGGDGEFANSSGGVDSGTWSLDDGVITLVPTKIGTDRSPMFLPAHSDRFVITRSLRGLLLTSVSTPEVPAASREEIVLRRTGKLPSWHKPTTEEPNQPVQSNSGDAHRDPQCAQSFWIVPSSPLCSRFALGSYDRKLWMKAG